MPVIFSTLIQAEKSDLFFFFLLEMLLWFCIWIDRFQSKIDLEEDVYWLNKDKFAT